jgi:hypothetical protein
MLRRLMVVASLAALTGCASQPTRILWREMLGKSINDFAEPLPENNQQKVWIHNMDDKECDKGCSKGVEAICSKGDPGGGGVAASLPSVGGLFGGGGGADKGGQWDGLAYEVFSNYLTQKHKGRVIEAHHHNYMTDANVSTHRTVDVVADGKSVGSYSGCEDLCLLDEAKKRHADKILAYQILKMEPEELLIHLRYSDSHTGLVEMSKTLKVRDSSISDSSF